MCDKPNKTDNADSHRTAAALQVVFVFLLFFVYAGWPAPSVNEAHYLTKSKHFWNPDWCPGDHYLTSGYAHTTFHAIVGWLTLYFSLASVAWIGRIVVWLLLAVAWQRLFGLLFPRRNFSALAAAIALCLWTRCHMAGEWIVGGLEAKGFAYVLVLLALGNLVKNQWRSVWILLGAASAFHVLVGGWSVIAAAFAWCVQPRAARPGILTMVPALIAGLLLALPGLIPTILLTTGSDWDTVAAGQEVYVFGRLAHHLVLHRFPPEFIARHVTVVLAWAALWWHYRLHIGNWRLGGFVCGAILIALVGGIIDAATIGHRAIAAGLLRFYWFRLTDVMVPVGLASGVCCLLRSLQERAPGRARNLYVVVLCVVAVVSADFVIRRHGDPRPGAAIQSKVRNYDLRPQKQIDHYRDWRDVCCWIAQTTPEDALFLTPTRQQTFKWYAGRSELVTWKDVPQDASTLVEWLERLRQTEEFERMVRRGQPSSRVLSMLHGQYGFDYVVITRPRYKARWSIRPAYSNESFLVYRMPSLQAPASSGDG